jgi:hypothetical protein
MKKWFPFAALTLTVLGGFTWGFCGWRDAHMPETATTASGHPDPYSSADAQRHFAGQPTHWASMVLITH